MQRVVVIFFAALFCFQFGCVSTDYYYDYDYATDDDFGDDQETDTDPDLVTRSSFSTSQFINDDEILNELAKQFEMKEFPSSERGRPLVVLFHGYSADQDSQRAYFKLGTLQKRFNVTLVTLNGEKDSFGHRFWNAGDACCDLDRSNPNHKERVAVLIRHLKQRYSASQVILWGHSNGAFFAYHLACEADDDLVDGVFALAGLQDKDYVCNRKRPLKVVHVHGTNDTVVRYEGGQVKPDIVTKSVTLAPHNSVSESFDTFYQINNCQGEEEYPKTFGDLFETQTKIREATGCDAVTLLITLPGKGHIPALSPKIPSYALNAMLSD